MGWWRAYKQTNNNDIMLSIIIPSRTEKYLNRTIEDIFEKATGDIEVIVILDGYPDDHPYVKDSRVKYISLPEPVNHERRKRQGVNAGVSISHGEYVMWVDAHCCFAKGFDETLIRDCEDDMVMIPRRYKISVKKWDRVIEDRPPIDYEYLMWQFLKKGRLSGYKWEEKSIEKKDIMIDDIFTCQASLIFMSRKWFDKMRFMQIEGYTGWGQEGEEMCLATIKAGGRAVVNKNTWYAHLHKGQMHGRMYKFTSVQPSYDYSFNYWVHENKEFFVKLMERFSPIPNLPQDWKEELYGDT